MAAVSLSVQKSASTFNIERPTYNPDLGLMRYKTGIVTLPATANNGDTTTVDLMQAFGITRLLGIIGFTHTTPNSVLVEEAPTTSVGVNTLTITVGGATGTKARSFIIYGV